MSNRWIDISIYASPRWQLHHTSTYASLCARIGPTPTPSRYQLISFISFPFNWATSSHDLNFGVRSCSTGTDNPIALHLLSDSCVFKKQKIQQWRWSSIQIWIVWRRLGFGRSHTIQGIHRDTVNPWWTCCDDSLTSAALVLASLSVLYRLCSCRGCCLSGTTQSPSAFFGYCHQKQTGCSRWCRSQYSGPSANNDAKTGFQHLKLPSAQRTLKYQLSALRFCLRVRGWVTRRITSFSTSQVVCLYSSSRFRGILLFLIGIGRTATITTQCVKGILRILEDRLEIVINSGRSLLSPAKFKRCDPSDMKIKRTSVSPTLSFDLMLCSMLLSLSISPYLCLPPPIRGVHFSIETFCQCIAVYATLGCVNQMFGICWLPHQPSHAFDHVSTPVLDRGLVIVVPSHILESV